MGHLDSDTELHGGDGKYRAQVSPEWTLLAPAGGFLSGLALRAAMLGSKFERPAGYVCHYLNRAQEGEVGLTVSSLRRSRRAESLRVEVEQGGAPILEALVWTAAAMDGPAHDTARMPAVPPPETTASIEDSVPGWPPFPFWANVDYRPLLLEGQEPYKPGPAALRTWIRFKPAATFADPAVAAIRLLLLADVFVYPAASMAHPWPTPFWATTLDFAATIHDPGIDAEWLLVDADAPVARGGLVGGSVRVWSESGGLLVSSVQQMLQLPT